MALSDLTDTQTTLYMLQSASTALELAFSDLLTLTNACTSFTGPPVVEMGLSDLPDD